MRRFHNLGDEVKKVNGECKYHPGALCNMIGQNVGFLLYLSWIDLPDNLEEKAIETTEDCETVTLMDIEEEEEEEELTLKLMRKVHLQRNSTQQSLGQTQ